MNITNFTSVQPQLRRIKAFDENLDQLGQTINVMRLRINQSRRELNIIIVKEEDYKREKIKKTHIEECKEEIRTMTRHKLMHERHTATDSTKVYGYYDKDGVLNVMYDCKTDDVDLDEYMKNYQPIEKYLATM